MVAINTQTLLGESKIQQTVDLQVNVAFKKNLTRTALINEIAKIDQPQVILWYMGAYGLREQAANYYRKDLKKILDLRNQAACVLYDLTAWRALKSSETKIEDFNLNADRINEIAKVEQLRIKCFKSSDFFKWLKTEENAKICAYFKETVLKREFIFQKSKQFDEVNIKIGQVFENACPILENEYERDCSKEYSALQYVEGCYLVNRLLEESLSNSSSEVNLVFALPNNEADYYQDPLNSFAQDITVLLQEKLGNQVQKKVNIMFYTFQFGKDSSNRPYNAGKANIDMINRSQLV